MLDNHYLDSTLVQLYDLECGWSADRQFYLELAGSEPIRILDFGCGTGLLCDAYAAFGHVVVGADPAPEMLRIARQKTNGSKVHWVNAPAQEFRSDQLFDLIIMTGHAFQVLQDVKSIVAVLRNIRAHLAPGGIAVFESRNPNIDWNSRWGATYTTLFNEDQAIKISCNIVRSTDSHISFEKNYSLGNRILTSVSTLHFPSYDVIADCIASSGLHLAEMFGDWDRGEFVPDKSDEMIFVTSLGASS